MKKNLILIILAIVIPPVILTSYFTPGDEYLVVGWNDLGMHCSNKDFDSIVILPPYNNFRAQVIKIGDENNNPEIITEGLTINYEIPGNTYSVGKTNFWSYEDQLFGVDLPDNIGLTGAGLTGSMAAASDHYWVDGVPITPYTDADLNNEDPFQLAKLDVYDVNNIFLATTQNVMPVSNEIGCVSSGCHSSQQDILDEHDDDGGFDPTDLPVLCANCHADVALGMPGIPGVESLSYVIHEKHAGKTNDCYKCHPGENSQCFRGVMHDGGMYCTDCHGDMEEVAHSISEGRRPWLDEPSCGTTSCHGSNYAEEPGKLFKDSKGHGGLYCSACHGSTHAIVPSTEPRDNVQNIALQGYTGTLGDCIACHGHVPDGPGPHGIAAPGLSTDATLSNLLVDGSIIEGFTSQTLSYTFEVPEGTTIVPVVEATPTNNNATVTITPASIIPGTTEVFVLAEDNVTNLTYTVEFIFETEESIILDEQFETGVPDDYFTGKLYLESGKWYAKYVKKQENGYYGEGIKLKKETTSYLQTPGVNSAGELSFYYKGDEDETDVFKVQKKIPGGKWVSFDRVSYNDNSWQFYSKTINDGADGLKIRIYKSKKQKSNLIIDQFLLTSYQQRMAPLVSGFDELKEVKTIEEVNIYVHSKSIYINTTQLEVLKAKLEIFDLNGKLVHQSNLSTGGITTIDNLIQNGFYIVRVNLGSQNFVKKVLVQ